MGVPAFFKWLSTKYPKIIVDCIESDEPLQPNPNGLEFDNLYLDMNGIIHPACHPEDQPPPSTEEDMCIAVFEYLQRIFTAIRPRKLCFIAIDGVAPRAKMNQQRTRRFKSAKEAQEKEEEEEILRTEWTAAGRVPPAPAAGSKFDSNVITPGTQFMRQLGSLLKAFVHEKVSNDPQWKGLHVIFSDSSVPGEGEHKIMDFIRSQRGAAGYDPNTRHVIHGLDADLILLALSTHEPHFSILREYTGPAAKPAAKPAATPATTPAPGSSAGHGRAPLQLLQIATLREYLDLEFSSTNFQPVAYSLERVIDDFVFLCCFVGNDFLPHLPSLQIRDGALDTLCALYVRHFQTIGGWITDGGEVDLERVRRFSAELAHVEPELLRQHASGEERYKQGQRRRELDKGNCACERRHTQMRTRLAAASGDTAVLGKDWHVFEIFEAIKRFSLLGGDAPKEALPEGLTPYQRAMAHNYCDELGVSNESVGAEPFRRLWMSKLGGGSAAEDEAFNKELAARCRTRSQLPDEADVIQLGRPGWRERFYSAKFPNLMRDADVDEQARDLASRFAEGLCFVMRYYYQGCPSWKWYYPYHYAPFAADLAATIAPGQPSFAFELGEPFTPLQQLLGVLPPRSAHALPACLAELMVAPTSPLADLYPRSFEVDMNGKRFMWQAIIKLPFIEERRLVEASKAAVSRDALEDGPVLTDDEAQRNRRGEALLIVGEECRTGVFRLLVDHYDHQKEESPPSLELTAAEGHELVGRLQLLPSEPRPHVTYPVPSVNGPQAAAALAGFESRAVSAAFSVSKPQAASSARPELLHGVVLDPSCLGPADRPRTTCSA